MNNINIETFQTYNEENQRVIKYRVTDTTVPDTTTIKVFGDIASLAKHLRLLSKTEQLKHEPNYDSIFAKARESAAKAAEAAQGEGRAAMLRDALIAFRDNYTE